MLSTPIFFSNNSREMQEVQSSKKRICKKTNFRENWRRVVATRDKRRPSANPWTLITTSRKFRGEGDTARSQQLIRNSEIGSGFEIPMTEGTLTELVTRRAIQRIAAWTALPSAIVAPASLSLNPRPCRPASDS